MEHLTETVGDRRRRAAEEKRDRERKERLERAERLPMGVPAALTGAWWALEDERVKHAKQLPKLRKEADTRRSRATKANDNAIRAETSRNNALQKINLVVEKQRDMESSRL